MADRPKQLTFEFVKSEGYRFAAVNGVWGGATPRGDICVDLFYECKPVPASVTHAFVATGDDPQTGKLGSEIERDGDSDRIERRVEFGMMLTADQAKSIGQWLLDQARQAEALRLAAQRQKKARIEGDFASSTSTQQH